MSAFVVNCTTLWFNGYSDFGTYQVGSIRLVPIYLILASAASNVIISTIVSVAIYAFMSRTPCGKAITKFKGFLCRRCKDGNEEQPPEENVKSFSKLIMTCNPYVLYLQALSALAHFLYVSIQTIRFKGANTGWNTYQLWMARVINSGILPTMITAGIRFGLNYVSGEEPKISSEEQAKIASEANNKVIYGFWISGIAMIGPALLTHIIPMLFAYLEITLLFIFVVLGGIWLSLEGIFLMNKAHLRKQRRWNAFAENFLHLLLAVLTISMFVLYIQMMFNYAVLLYGKKYSYVDVMSSEFRARNTHCYFADIDSQFATVEQMWNKISYLW